ncbi:hypothetical protein ACPDHD_11905 [Myroides odoratimimus]|uniref:hypothetical protein n=1 Tax=Myroides odoratimimus TaxID=76832 RepID=UPI002576856B|nr:hypothetical protein [Myroides odoratimimus]MDM1325903.1 hypothetical protein [Myroides odoratimimus]MDM1452192.1 hypothetical protein [Myroides odoratimimus]MDM1475469.1 hypothetical protein [Myroides odoratimimus]MDM1488244.1 hypothetical protein [Myroides odoratimimus]
MALKFDCCATCAFKKDEGCYEGSNGEIIATCDNCNNGSMYHEYDWDSNIYGGNFFDIEEEGIFIMTRHEYYNGYHFESIVKATNHVKILYDYITHFRAYKRFKVLIGIQDCYTYDKLCADKESFIWIRKYNNDIL